MHLDLVVQAGGMHYQYVDDIGNPIEIDKKLKGYATGDRSARSVKVVNKTTGVEFNSMSEAGESLGVTSAAISWAVRTGKHCRGNEFVKI